MKKNVVSLLLTIVLAAGSIMSAAPARAAETTAQEAVIAAEDIEIEQETEIETELTQEEAAVEDNESEPAQNGFPEGEEFAGASESEPTTDKLEKAEENIEAAPGQEETAVDAEAGSVEEEIAISVTREAAQDVVASGECGADARWTLEGTGDDLTLTISGSGEVSPGNAWSEYKTSIRKVVVESGITGIGWNSFSGCSGITSVELPDSLTEISSYAFEKCTSLTEIRIPDKVTSIESSAFSGCTNLTSAELPDGLEKIGTYAFENCGSLTDFSIPKTVKNLGGTAFKGCSSLTSIEIPDKVTEIGGSTFFGCSGLTSVTIPESVSTIGAWSFYNCSSLITLEIPEGVRRIGDRAFEGCTALQSVLIPDSVNSIQDGSFSGFTGTLTVYIGSYAEEFAKEKEIDYKAICKVHAWSDEWVVVKEPAYMETGLRERACEICGEKEQEEIPALTSKPIEDLKIRGIKDKTHTGKPVTQDVRIIDGDYTLAEGTDYTLSYENNTDIGLASVTITGEGVYAGSVIMGFAINPAAPKTVRATNVAPGMKLRWDKVEGATSYYVYRDNKFLFRTSALEATDKEVKDKNGVKLTYKVVASAKVDGTDYDSDVFRTTTYYRLIPVGIKSVKNTAAGKMTVTYDKNAKSTGYVVRFGLKSDMSDAKVITVSGAGTLSKTFSGFKKGKTYYVQVRTYKLENGVRYYSGYCTTKTVKITK